MKKPFEWQSATAQSIVAETGLDPVAGAIRLAADLVKLAGLEKPGHSLDALASFQDAKIEEIEMQDAGMLTDVREWPDARFSFLIHVNAADSRARKNFSICHEIGHTLMPNYNGNSGPRCDAQTMRWDKGDEEEYLCDVAAAELLMPRREFVPRLRGCGMRIEAIRELAEEFGASLEATAVNVVGANVDDVAVLVWELDWNKNQKKGAVNPTLPFDTEDEVTAPHEREYRIKFARASGTMQHHYFPRGISTEADSLICQAAQTDNPVWGWQELRIGGDQRQKFFVQSQSFSMRRGDAFERKIFTLVQEKPPADAWYD